MYVKIDLPMKRLLIALLLVSLFAGFQPKAEAQQYDGIWFLGFNMKKDVFSGPSGKTVRQAFNHAINRAYICREIIGDAFVPTGVIPPGLPGHDKSIKGYSYSTARAKNLLNNSRAGRLKGLKLIHTDGQKTAKIAQAIKKDLSAAGIEVSLKQIEYEEDDTWERELSAGGAHLFLMGYKVPPQPFEKNDPVSRSEKFLYELFHSKGEANMFFLRNKEIDAIIETTAVTLSEEMSLKDRLMKKTDRMLFYDPVTVNLFYIKELQ